MTALFVSCVMNEIESVTMEIKTKNQRNGRNCFTNVNINKISVRFSIYLFSRVV